MTTDRAFSHPNAGSTVDISIKRRKVSITMTLRDRETAEDIYNTMRHNAARGVVYLNIMPGGTSKPSVTPNDAQAKVDADRDRYVRSALKHAYKAGWMAHADNEPYGAEAYFAKWRDNTLTVDEIKRADDAPDDIQAARRRANCENCEGGGCSSCEGDGTEGAGI